jgi:hypothetical protein
MHAFYYYFSQELPFSRVLIAFTATLKMGTADGSLMLGPIKDPVTFQTARSIPDTYTGAAS